MEEINFFENSDMKTDSEEMKNPSQEVGNIEGSQRDSIEYKENKAVKQHKNRDSNQENEKKDFHKNRGRKNKRSAKKNLLIIKKKLKEKQKKG